MLVSDLYKGYECKAEIQETAKLFGLLTSKDSGIDFRYPKHFELLPITRHNLKLLNRLFFILIFLFF